MAQPAALAGSGGGGDGRRPGAARRRREQARRAQARHVGWLCSLRQAELSHHTAPTSTPSLADLAVRVAALENLVGAMQQRQQQQQQPNSVQMKQEQSEVPEAVDAKPEAKPTPEQAKPEAEEVTKHKASTSWAEAEEPEAEDAQGVEFEKTETVEEVKTAEVEMQGLLPGMVRLLHHRDLGVLAAAAEPWLVGPSGNGKDGVVDAARDSLLALVQKAQRLRKELDISLKGPPSAEGLKQVKAQFDEYEKLSLEISALKTIESCEHPT